MKTSPMPFEYHGNKKLSPEDIETIRTLHKQWVMPSELSMKYHVSYHCIRYVLGRRKNQKQEDKPRYDDKHNEKRKTLLKKWVLKRLNAKIRSWYKIQVYKWNDMILEKTTIKDVAHYMHVSYSTVNACLRAKKQDKHWNRYVGQYY